MKQNDTQTQPLWTRDFTIITLGSVVSMFGNSMSGFALSLLVLDHTDSSFLYALVIALFTAPNLITPIFSGAILDRFSRKKMIYGLDFLSAALYGISAVVFHFGNFPFFLLGVYAVILGSIQSIYMVAYESFYPLLITEGNYSKAYSISSVLETLSVVMVPVSAFLYNRVGISPLLAINAVTFFIAAVLETQIRAEEHYVETQKETRDASLSAGRQMLRDIKEGFLYLWQEKGLLAVAVYFTFSSFAGGASQVIALPWFRNTFEGGEYVFMSVFVFALIGRMTGGLIHYRIKLPKEKKYDIALTVYIATSIIEGVYLFTPLPWMRVLCFMTGILGITSYTIRISATQKYVPDEKKGRFNGAFGMMNTAGGLLGELLGGAAAGIFAPRLVQVGFMGICLLAAIFVIGGNRKAVAAIYNTEQ